MLLHLASNQRVPHHWAVCRYGAGLPRATQRLHFCLFCVLSRLCCCEHVAWFWKQRKGRVRRLSCPPAGAVPVPSARAVIVLGSVGLGPWAGAACRQHFYCCGLACPAPARAQQGGPGEPVQRWGPTGARGWGQAELPGGCSRGCLVSCSRHQPAAASSAHLGSKELQRKLR